MTTADTKAPPAAVVATHPAIGSPNRRPPTTSVAKPASGKAAMSHDACKTCIRSPVSSALEDVEVVGRRPGPAAEDGHDDAEADHDLGRGHHEHKEHGHLPAEVVEH